MPDKKKNNQLILPDETLMSKIYFIRGQKVMTDRDLAKLYDVKAIRLREQVKRNLEKFPIHFMFQLTKAEVEVMVSQNAIPSKQHLGGALPYVFTEHGVLELSNVLNSGRATQMSIRIIEVFVKMREMLTDNLSVKLEIEEIKKKLINQDKNIELVFFILMNLLRNKRTRNQENKLDIKEKEKNNHPYSPVPPLIIKASK